MVPKTLTTDTLGRMLDRLREEYDIVIIDSPPLLPVSDSLLLSQSADSILFVVRWNETLRSAVKKALAMLSIARSVPIRLVFNMVDPQKYQDEFYGGYTYDE